MNGSKRGDLASRLDSVVEEAQGRVKTFQADEESKRRSIQLRFQAFLPIAERIVALAREKLERLQERLKFDVVPAQLQTERFYSRSVTLNVKSELAGTIEVSFRLTHDSDVEHLLLDYNLEIIPIFFRFNPHSRLEMALEAYDEATVGQWLDDCIVEFANAFVEMHSTRQYQERVMVPDTVAGVSFPKHYAAATLEHDGKTYYFISEESRREFANRHGLTT